MSSLSNTNTKASPSSSSLPSPLTSDSASGSLQRTIVVPMLSEKRPLESGNVGHINKKKKKFGTPVHNDFICEDCRAIDLERVLVLDNKKLQNSVQGIHVAELGMRCLQSLENGCTLCQLFSEVRIPTNIPYESSGYQLRAYSYLRHNSSISFKDIPSRLKGRDLPYLAVVSDTFMNEGLAIEANGVGLLLLPQQGSMRQSLLTLQVVPHQVDLSIVSSWLRYCTKYHKKLCSTREKHLEGLKVIDCDSMTIIPAPPRSSYAALSYVWGPPKDKTNRATPPSAKSPCLLPLSPPKVISDAIIVTKKLKLKYLWIDKYCIDQNNAKEKHEHISQMDAIYRRAELTIIAAAGEDENFGLPGVGATPRKGQPVSNVGKIQVVSTMSHPHHTIPSSKWASRGWTYQEAILSRRRLVFTEDQVYFECNAMNCCESVNADFDLVHTKDKSKSLLFMHSGIFTGAKSFRPQDEKDQNAAANFQSYCEHIQQFSKRKLSFESDSFKAFAGIAGHFERSNSPSSQTWGIPMVSLSTMMFDVINLNAGLYWKHQHNFWSGLSEPRRRPEFPSWSWIGWAGEVEFPAASQLRHGSIFGLRVASITTTNLTASPSANPGGILHLQTKVVPSSLISIDDTSVLSMWRIAGSSATLSLSHSQGPESLETIAKRCTDEWELADVSTQRDDQTSPSQGQETADDFLNCFARGYWKLVKIDAHTYAGIAQVLYPYFLVIRDCGILAQAKCDAPGKLCHIYERLGVMTVDCRPSEIVNTISSSKSENIGLL